MELKELFNASNIKLDLEVEGKDEVLLELINLLRLDEKAKEMLFKMLKKRENLGSTGIGKGFAIPHCRSLVVDKLNVAFARHRKGVDFNSIDDKPAHYFFLIVAPPVEISNYYLPVLGKVAQFCKISDITNRLEKLGNLPLRRTMCHRGRLRIPRGEDQISRCSGLRNTGLLQ